MIAPEPPAGPGAAGAMDRSSSASRGTALAVRHLAFEDLGAFAPALVRAGYQVVYVDIDNAGLPAFDPLAPELLFVLGGPIGACEDDKYPFLKDELRLLDARLGADRPVFGVCLGAQLMARVLGGRVYPAPAKEIGFAPVRLSEAGQASPLAALEGAAVLHWHGDTFDLPNGAVRLASTDICENQAFAYGKRALAAQFHPEAGGEGFERWLVGHALELSMAGVDVPKLRAENARRASDLAVRAARCLEAWLEAVD